MGHLQALGAICMNVLKERAFVSMLQYGEPAKGTEMDYFVCVIGRSSFGLVAISQVVCICILQGSFSMKLSPCFFEQCVSSLVTRLLGLI